MNGETHPTRFTLERLLADDLADDERNAAERHLQACGSCRAAFAALEADAEAFRAEVPYAPFRIEHEARRAARPVKASWLRLWLPGIATAAAVASAILITVVPRGDDPPGTRIKGGPVALTFSVLEAGVVRPGVAGETLTPGTRLQLSYEAGDNTHIAVVGLDAAGNVGRYFPEKGTTLVPVPGAAKGSLPFSLALDETLGAERFIAVFAGHAAPIAGLLHAIGDRAGADPATLPPIDLPEGLSQSSVWIRKE
jgi:hypothetical protein